jgi:osmoprotectant transport system substrate-binding protein/osmoprotectant transport system permease protein
VSLLSQAPGGSPAATLGTVRREFLARWDLWWLAPLGFENAYELAVPRRFAAANRLATLSDLAAWSRAHPGELRAALGYEFVERPDGLPGLERAYGLAPGRVEPMQQALKYRAAAAGDADVIDVYTTDGRLLTYDLVVLADDRGFFPPYQAAPLMRGAVARAHPEAVAALSLLAGAFDEEAMRRFNRRLQEGNESEAAVAADALRELGLVGGGERSPAGSADGGGAGGRREGLLRYAWSRRALLGRRTLEHLGLSAAALALGVLVAVPLGLALERRRGAAEGVIRAVALTQTVPSLALLAFMIPLLGVGAVPAMAALWIYSLFPILRNTYSGVRDADPEAVAAAVALGMTPAQVLTEIRLPLAAPVIMAGVRTAAVLTVGTATLAAFIGAGGLGEPIVTGLQLADTRMILSGAIPAALLALAVDTALGGVERLLRPAGLEG